MKGIINSEWLMALVFILKIDDGNQMPNNVGFVNDQSENHWDISSKYGFSEINHEIKVLRLSNADYRIVPDELMLNMFENLECLDLSGKKIREIPKTFERYFKSLKTLDLSSNVFSIWTCCYFHNLTHLNLSHNRITQITSNAMKCLPNIRIIHLEGNFLTVLPSNLFKTNKVLTDLFISQNKFEVFPLIHSKSIESLDISQCKIKYVDSNQISTMPSLNFLNISLNEIKYLQIKQLLDTIIIDVGKNPGFTSSIDIEKEISMLADYSDKNSRFAKEYERSDQEKVDVQSTTADIIATSITAFTIGALFGGMLTALICACANTKCCTSDNTVVVAAENENRNSNQMVIRIPLRIEDDPPTYQEALQMRRSFHSLPELSVNPLAEQLSSRLSRSTNDILVT